MNRTVEPQVQRLQRCELSEGSFDSPCRPLPDLGNGLEDILFQSRPLIPGQLPVSILFHVRRAEHVILPKILLPIRNELIQGPYDALDPGPDLLLLL